MTAPDVIVLGAGIVGAGCASALARDGARVLVLDENPIGSGATAAGMGHVLVMDGSEAELALTNYSRDLWLQLAPALPAEAEFRTCGTIWIAANQQEFQLVIRKHNSYRDRSIRTEILDSISLCELEPNLRSGLAGGLLVPDDSVVNAFAVAKYLLQSHPESIRFRQCAPVVRVDTGKITLASGETLKASEIVCALGCGSANLFPELGIRPRKGHLAITDRYPGFANHQLIELGYLNSAHGSSDESIAFNVQPRAGGQILIGSSRQFGEHLPDVDPKLLSRMIRHAAAFMPAIEHVSIARTWTGFRAATPDKLPFIGPHPEIPNITLATGHEGLGIATSLATAELVAAHIRNGRPAISSEPYLPSESRLFHALPNRT